MVLRNCFLLELIRAWRNDDTKLWTMTIKFRKPRSPRNVGDKVIYGEVAFQVLHPVLGIRLSTIRIVHYPDRQFKIGDEAAVAVFAEVILIFEKH